MSTNRPLSFIPSAKPIIGEDEVEAVSAVLRSGMVAQGPQVAEFEEEFSEQLVDGAHAVAVNPGTSALRLALLAAGIGSGDEVLVPSFTFAATANSVAMTGATPVFVDIEADYFCMDPKAAAGAITDRTKAVPFTSMDTPPTWRLSKRSRENMISSSSKTQRRHAMPLSTAKRLEPSEQAPSASTQLRI